MNVLYYYSNDARIQVKAEDVMDACCSSGVARETVHTPLALAARIQRERYSILLMVVFVVDGNELDALCGLEKILADIPMILILPDMSRDTLAKAHRMVPRYISSSSGDLSDVKQVVEKLIEKTRKSRGGH